MAEKENTNFGLLGLVGIVAIVGIVGLVMNFSASSGPGMTANDENLAGEAKLSDTVKKNSLEFDSSWNYQCRFRCKGGNYYLVSGGPAAVSRENCIDFANDRCNEGVASVSYIGIQDSSMDGQVDTRLSTR